MEHDALRAVVSQAVGRQVATLRDVRREPLDYDAFLAHRAVVRLQGIAMVDGEPVPWSMIEKRTEGPRLASPYLLDNSRREFDAYSSGLLDDIAPGIRGPRAYGTVVDPDGRITLWLEEIRHEGPRPLAAEAILAAARDLGGLSGRWYRREPLEPWLFSDWIERHAQSEAIDQGLATLRSASADAVARLGGRLDLAEQLILKQPCLRKILESLPLTLCHHDAVGSNVFQTTARTVLIDWESIGPGPIGADLASLLFSSGRRGDASVAVIFSVLEEALQCYAEGIWAEGAELELEDVRRGFDAVALRWKLAADIVAGIDRGDAPRRGSLPEEAPETALAELVQLVDLLLASANRVLD